MLKIIKKKNKLIINIILIIALFLSSFSPDFLFSYRNSSFFYNHVGKLLKIKAEVAQASSLKIQTGYYMGDGQKLSISGLGFKPDLVMIKSDFATIPVAFKINEMPDENVAYFSALADNRGSRMTLDDDGFTVNESEQIVLDINGFTVSQGANINVENIRYVWVAIAGSDCSETGVFCVGKYTGDASATKNIITGFQPDSVIVKRSATVAAHFATKYMNAGETLLFTNTVIDTTGNYISSLNANGFTVGATDNALGSSFYYIAFKESASFFKAGYYTGSGADNRSISGVGFRPDLVIVKAQTNQYSVMNLNESYGDSSSYVAVATANLADSIQLLESDGFQVGTSGTANTIDVRYHFLALTGASPPQASGTFKMVTGSYEGDGGYKRITGLDFTPDLIIIKADSNKHSVFRTSLMAGDSTAYLSSATANITGAIISITVDGFNLGNHDTVNQSGVQYHWQAFGGAYNPHTNSGSADFAIGAYYGNGIAGRSIARIPFQSDLVAIKRNGASLAVFKPSSITDGNALYFVNTTQGTGIITSLDTNGFTIGSSAVSNTAANINYWFSFKKNSSFTVASYTGTGLDNRDVTGLGFDPNLVWVKRTTNIQGVFRPDTLTGDNSHYFVNSLNVSGRIKSFITDGFRVGTQTEVNTLSGVYHYAAWKKTIFDPPVGLPSAPANFSISNINKTTLDLNWSAVSGATQYRIERAIDIEGEPGPYRRIAIVATNSFSDSGLGPNNSYWYRVRAENESGLGPYSSEEKIATLAQTLKIKTGYYVGNGETINITGLDFSPELVMIKSDTAATVTIFKTSVMPKANISFFSALADNASVNINAEGVRYIWTAIAGSDCSETGSFCLGCYAGDSNSTKSIVTGFTPDAVLIKRSTAVAAHFATKYMNAGQTLLFSNTAIDSTGNYISSLNADGFTAGATDNGIGGSFYYIAMKENASFFKAGYYTGDGLDNRNISDVGFRPNLVIIKAETNQHSVMNTNENNGDYSSYIGSATANLVDAVQLLNSSGFQIGTNAIVNSSGVKYHFLAFTGMSPPQSSGTFKMAVGSYTGNGLDKKITGVGFSPDLVIIKANNNQFGVFRTKLLPGDSTFYLGQGTANIPGAIMTIDSDGFSLGNHSTVNQIDIEYQWQAFGNAYNPYTNTGASDFAIGVYTGNGIAGRDISGLNFRPNFLSIKTNTAYPGVWRSSELVGDLSSFFGATAETANYIQAINDDGFKVGIASRSVNYAAYNFYWFAFKEGSNFDVGTYSGTGVADPPNDVVFDFKPDLVWVKRSAAVNGVFRPSTLLDDNTQYFFNVANAQNRIVSLLDNGFRLGNNQTETNTSGGTYRYVAWKIPTSGYTSNIQIRSQNYSDLVSNITFPKSPPGATVSNPYNNVDGVNNSQSFGGAGVAKPVVTLYNSGNNALKIWYNITSFTNNIIFNEYFTIKNKGGTCSDVDCVDQTVVFDTNTDTGATISPGSDNEKDLYLKVILGSFSDDLGTSTITILGESL